MLIAAGLGDFNQNLPKINLDLIVIRVTGSLISTLSIRILRIFLAFFRQGGTYWFLPHFSLYWGTQYT